MRGAADAQMRHEAFMADVAQELAEHRASMTEIAILRGRMAMLRKYLAAEKAAGWESVPISSVEVYLGLNGSAA